MPHCVPLPDPKERGLVYEPTKEAKKFWLKYEKYFLFKKI